MYRVLTKYIVVPCADISQYGADVKRCAQLLTSGGKYTEAQVRQAVDSLATEGHIYSTVDEDHYQFAM
jgi:hypothetical protein